MKQWRYEATSVRSRGYFPLVYPVRSPVFRPDHTVEARAETQAGLLSIRGTFVLRADQVTLKWASGDEAEAVARIEITPDGQTMTLITDGSTRTVLHRSGTSC